MQDEINRRTVLRSAGAGLALASAGGIASAQEPNDSSASGKKLVPIVIKDGKLELVVTDSRGNRISTQRIIRQTANSDESDRTATRAVIRNGWITGWDAAVMLADGVKKLNSLEEKGLVTFEEADSTISVVPTQKLTQQYEESTSTDHPSVGTMSCGKNDYKVEMPGFLDPYVHHKLWTDDENTQRLKADLAKGGISGGGLAGIIQKAKYRELAILAIILSARAGMIAEEMGAKNDGCGILTLAKHVPMPPGGNIGQLAFNTRVKSQ